MNLNEIKKLKEILNNFKNYPPNKYFNIDPRIEIPNYEDIINHPMWFSKIFDKLEKNKYNSPKQFFDDLKLIFKNCELFNKGDLIFEIVAKHGIFQVNELENSFNEEKDEEIIWMINIKKCLKSINKFVNNF